MPEPRWIINIDHIDDPKLEFVGWYRVADDGDFSVYRRPYDGEEQVVQNEPPRFFVVDDYNDAQILSSGRIIRGPDDC